MLNYRRTLLKPCGIFLYKNEIMKDITKETIIAIVTIIMNFGYTMIWCDDIAEQVILHE